MARPDPAGADRLRVLFVGGLGRSGSTLLARLLAQAAGGVALGELGAVWERGFAQNVRCGCGLPFRSCELWRAVSERAGLASLPAATLDELLELWRRRGARLAPPALWSPRMRARLRLHATHLGALLHAAAAVSGARLVVDATKSPAHLAALEQIAGIELHVVHLVRDSRAVAYSWQLGEPRAGGQRSDLPWPVVSPLLAALAWNVANLTIGRARRRAASHQRVRYEDFARAPHAIVAGLLRGAGLPVQAAGGTVELPIDHTVAGNPVRFVHGPVEVREDVEWRTRMPRRSRLAVTALTWPLLAAYGYEI